MLMLKTMLRALTGAAIVFCLLLPLFSCTPPVQESVGQTGTTDGIRDPQDYAERDKKDFYAQNVATGAVYTVNAVLLAENERCIVYGERAANISVATAENIADRVYRRIDPLMLTHFGDFRVNLAVREFLTSSKLVLLLLDIKDSYEPGKTDSYVAGYFHAKDLNSRSYSSTSNQMPIIYMDVNPGKPEEEGEFFNTIAHELQHLINYSIRVAAEQKADGYAALQETWIDEGLASAAEYLYKGGHITEKINYFNYDGDSAFALGNNFLIWDGGYIDYCTVYLFFQWLRIHADAGPAIYRDIINSSYTDYRAVLEAAARHIKGIESGDWETLLSRWFLANHVNAPGGFLGYGGEIADIHVKALTGYSRPLPPGGGVFSYLNGGFAVPAYPPSGPNIRYIGVDGSGNLVADLAGFGGTGRLLTFNANPSLIDTTPENGYLSGSTGAPPSGIPRTAVPPQGPYPIDIPPSFLTE
jgi:hypothetical protein